jgi:hypothetical protein
MRQTTPRNKPDSNDRTVVASGHAIIRERGPETGMRYLDV